MTLWLSLAILAQLITAAAVLIDKHVLLNKGHIGNPIVYAFYVSLLSGFVLILVPFGYITSWPSLAVFELSCLAAVAYMVSLVFLYRALKEGYASDVMPVVGAIAALTTYALSHFFLKQDLPTSFGLAFILLIFGTLIISRFRFTRALFIQVVIAGVLFGVSSILLKFVFLKVDFVDGFFWSRMANVLIAVALLLWPGNIRRIFGGMKHTHARIKWLVVCNKALSGVAFVLTLRAIQLGSVTIVNALAGLQFIFLFLFAVIFARAFPRMFRAETHRRHELLHKMIATVCIAVGLGVLLAPAIVDML